MPIYLHPSRPHPSVMKAYFDGYEELALGAWGFGIDTGTHFLRLVFAGVFDAFPKLNIILGHLGEGLPFMLHRINDQTQLAAARRGLKRTAGSIFDGEPGRHLQREFFDPCLPVHSHDARIDNVMFSVDWPYESNSTAVDFLKRQMLDEHDMEKVAHLNAERVLRL